MHQCKLELYSKDVQEIIYGLVKIYDEYCSNIIIYGSAAQNKLTYRRINGKIEFFSDMEFYVVPKSKINENNKAFNKMLMNKSFEFLNGMSNLISIPFIDVYSVAKSFFSESEARISTYELKNNGIVLKGENLLSSLVEIDKFSYNPKIQNIEIVKGLKILLLGSYNWYFINRDYSDEEKKMFYYFLSSSFLNLLRTLLPYVGEFKLSNEERVELLDDLTIRERILLYFSQNIISQFKLILEDKTNCRFSYAIDELFIIVFEGYMSMLSMLLDCAEDEIVSKIDENKNTVFYGSKEKVNLLAQLSKFFVLALNCVKQSMLEDDIHDEIINSLIKSFDVLMECKNQSLFGLSNLDKLSKIVGQYEELEKVRWRIIGSKD